MSMGATSDVAGPEADSRARRTVLFPDVRLDEVLRFKDELLLPLRVTKSWQDPASPAWLGGALCALAAAIGPMVRLFLPGGPTVAPTFNAIVTVPSDGSLEFNRRLLTPLRSIQTSARNRRKSELNTILTSSLKVQELTCQFSRTINGALVIADEKTALLDRFLKADEQSQWILARTLQTYVEPKKANTLDRPMWSGSLHTLMFGQRSQLPDLASSPLLQADSYPHILILSEDFTPYDISPGHEFGFKERAHWNDLVNRVTGAPHFWAMEKNRRIDCPQDAAAPLLVFRSELRELLKVVHPAYHIYLAWLPDLAASIALTIWFAQNPGATTVDRATVQHAVTITKWLANCHFKGLQEMLQVDPVPDVSDKPAIPDRQRLILEKLRVKGPMRPREISRSCYRMKASARDQALKWLREREMVVFRDDGVVQAVNWAGMITGGVDE